MEKQFSGRQVLEFLKAFAFTFSHNFEDVEFGPTLKVVTSLFNVLLNDLELGAIGLESLNMTVHAFVDVIDWVDLFLLVEGAQQDA